jgi:hypothetical protein
LGWLGSIGAKIACGVIIQLFGSTEPEFRT